MTAIFITFLVTTTVMLPAGAYLHYHYGSSVKAVLQAVETRVQKGLK
jgi:hypothetical protein